MIDTDRAWFKKNSNANFRLRRPADGEVEELAKRMVTGAGYQLELAGGRWTAPEGQEWSVIVINVSADTIVRMLTVRDAGAPLNGDTDIALYTVAIGNRLAIDKRRA